MVKKLTMLTITNWVLKTYIYNLLIILFFCSFSLIPLQAEKPPNESHYKRINTTSPRATLETFLEAMNTHRKALRTKKDTSHSKNENKDIGERSIEHAIQTLNLEAFAPKLRKQKGKERAIALKEILDRTIVLTLPHNTKEALPTIEQWRLGNTELVISKVKQGRRKGEYLFSSETVKNASKLYKKIKHLPYLAGSGQGSGHTEPHLSFSLPLWVQTSFLFLAWWQWGGLFLAITGGFISRALVRFILFLIIHLVKNAGIFQSSFLVLIERITKPLSYLSAIGIWFLAIFILQLSELPLLAITIVLKIMLSTSLVWLVYEIISHCCEYLQTLAQRTNTKLDDRLLPLITRSLKVFTVLIGCLISVQNLGINVASLLAGLGLGGLAFALAAREALANLFGSIMILTDRPFQIGDWVKINNCEGKIEDIGFRSTRIRTFYDSLISIPNSKVASSEIDNLGARTYRRVVANLDIIYSTAPEKLEAFLEGIKNIIKANSYTRKDAYHVVFKEYASSSLVVMVYCFLKVEDWATELVEKQNLYIEIFRLAKDIGIEFAFPTQTLHVENFPEKRPLHHPDSRPTSAEEIQKMQETVQQYNRDGSHSRPAGLGIYTPHFREHTK